VDRAWNTISRQYPATWPRRHVCSCCRFSSSWDRRTPCLVDSAVRGLVFLDRRYPASLRCRGAYSRGAMCVCMCIRAYVMRSDLVSMISAGVRESIPFSRREKELEREREREREGERRFVNSRAACLACLRVPVCV